VLHRLSIDPLAGNWLQWKRQLHERFFALAKLLQEKDNSRRKVTFL
jgi:hypothetical protein